MQRVRPAGVAMAVLSRFNAAWTMNSMVREDAGMLFQELGNSTGFESSVGARLSALEATQGIGAETHSTCHIMYWKLTRVSVALKPASFIVLHFTYVCSQAQA